MYSNNNIIKKEIKMNLEKEDYICSERKRERQGEILFFIFSSLHFFLRSMEIGSYDFFGVRGKVDLCDEGYAWVPKSWSFVKLYKVGNFPTCVIFSLKAI